MCIENEEIIRFLPDRFKMEYYKSIVKNGQIDNGLLREIIGYFEQIYKKSIDAEELLMKVLKNSDSKEREELLEMIKENNLELYNEISTNIFDFEDIVKVDEKISKKVLEKLDKQTVVKASMSASPKVNDYLQNVLGYIDFTEERNSIGSTPINEIIDIHNKIVDLINKEK